MITANESALSVEACAGVVDAEITPHPFMGGGRSYTPNFVTICSIWPEEVRATFLEGGRKKEYTIPATPKGQYALLRVYDTYTIVRNTSVESFGADAYMPAPKHARGIAENLVRRWAKDAPGNAGGSEPGIAIIAGDKPTQLELDQLFAGQMEYFRYLVRKADQFWVTKEGTITEDHRRALKWLGSEDREWFKKIDSVQFKRCKACAEPINIEAIRCRHCSTDLLKFYREIGVEPTPEEDPAIARLIAQQAAARAAAQAVKKA